jgi:hypothetical protein
MARRLSTGAALIVVVQYLELREWGDGGAMDFGCAGGFPSSDAPFAWRWRAGVAGALLAVAEQVYGPGAADRVRAWPACVEELLVWRVAWSRCDGRRDGGPFESERRIARNLRRRVAYDAEVAALVEALHAAGVRSLRGGHDVALPPARPRMAGPRGRAAVSKVGRPLGPAAVEVETRRSGVVVSWTTPMSDGSRAVEVRVFADAEEGRAHVARRRAGC